MANEYQSITGGEGGKLWQQRALSCSLASVWWMLCLTVHADRDSHNALQNTVWRLNFLQAQSPNPLHPLVASRDDASRLAEAVMWPLIVLPWWLITNPDRVKPLWAVSNNRLYFFALGLTYIYSQLLQSHIIATCKSIICKKTMLQSSSDGKTVLSC